MIKLASHYTAQAIVNGTSEFIGFNEKRMRSEISKTILLDMKANLNQRKLH